MNTEPGMANVCLYKYATQNSSINEILCSSLNSLRSETSSFKWSKSLGNDIWYLKKYILYIYIYIYICIYVCIFFEAVIIMCDYIPNFLFCQIWRMTILNYHCMTKTFKQNFLRFSCLITRLIGPSHKRFSFTDVLREARGG